MDWIKLVDFPKYAQELKGKFGVYILRWVKNEKPVEIKRIGGVDPKGILYIGTIKRKDLKDRISNLQYGTLKRKAGYHTAADSFIFFSLHELVKDEELEVAWSVFKTIEECNHQEWLALKNYAEKFKELPPLNLVVGREKFAVIGIAKVGKVRVAGELDKKLKMLIN